MQYFRTTISHGSTGTKSINVGFPPVAARITIGSKYNNTDLVNHLSIGNTNGTTSSYHSTFSDTSSHQTISGTGKLGRHFARISGLVTEVINLDTPSFVGNQFQYNVAIADASYQLHVEAWG